MNKRVAIGVVIAAFAANVVVGDDNVVAFWDFKGGEAGASVTPFTNSSGSGSFTSELVNVYNGSPAPVYSAANPKAKIYTDSTYDEVAVENAQSIFFNYKALGKNNGGCIDIPNLGTELSKLTNYTVEAFLRYESIKGWRWPQALAVETATSSWYFRSGCGTDDCRSELVAGGEGGKVSPGTNVWFHIAIVYEEEDAENHTGTLKYYYNGALKNTFSNYANVPTEEAKKVRLGYMLGNAGNESYNYRGEICALRIKGVSLKPEQFLAINPYDIDKSGTIALMTLSGKTAGESAASFALDGGDFADVAQATGSAMNCETATDTGVVPLYDEDVPGKYLFSSHDRSTLVSSDWRSLKFTTAGAPNTQAKYTYNSIGGGLISIENLSSALSCQKNYTVEMFVKDEDWSEFIYSRGVFAYDSLAPDGTRFRNSYEISSSSSSSKSWYSHLWAGVGSTTTEAKQTKATTWKDSAWHHVAIVYDGARHEATTYIDYVANAPAAYSNSYVGATGYPFYLGASRCSVAPTTTTAPRSVYCFRGKIAGMRIVPRMLEADEFMIASNSLEESPTVFALNFEEGKEKVGTRISQTVNTPLSPYSDYTYGYVYKFLDSSIPEWSDAVNRKTIVKWGDAIAHTNATSMHLYGIHSATEAEKTTYSSIFHYAGTVVARFGSDSDSFMLAQNPTNWTMEAFFKMEHTDETVTVGGQAKTFSYRWVLFGKAGCPTANRSGAKETPSLGWSLSTHPTDRRWKLSWTEDDGNVDPSSSEAGTGGVGKSHYFSGDAEIFDKRWHHIAVTYNAGTKEFELFVDYVSKGTAAAGETGPLWNGPYDYCFGRGLTGETNFEGWMDEVRLSRKVLTPSEMIHLDGGPGMLILIR